MDMNRREFLRTAGKAAVGAVAVSSLPLPVVAEGKETPVWPWKYVPLDKDELLKMINEPRHPLLSVLSLCGASPTE